MTVERHTRPIQLLVEKEGWRRRKRKRLTLSVGSDLNFVNFG